MLYAFPVLSIFPEHIKKAFYKMYVTICDFDQDEDEVAVANYDSQIQEYIPQSKVCGLRKCFFDTSQRVFEKGFLQGVRHNLREIWPE